MNLLTTLGIFLALLGSAIIGGVFFAFSSFVMKALARVPASAGIAAMQSINVVVLNASFLGAFIGTAALAVLVVLLAAAGGFATGTPYVFAGALLYVVGTFLVTMFGNVPLNERLATISADDAQSDEVWRHYLDRWTWLNSVRAAAALAATAMFALGLMHGGATA